MAWLEHFFQVREAYSRRTDHFNRWQSRFSQNTECI
jgi:hypothetical protein